MQVPKDTVQAVTRKPITWALGFLGGIVAHNYLDSIPMIASLPKFAIGNTSVGVADAIKAGLDLAIGMFGERIPIVGSILKMLGGSRPFGYGMLGYLGYRKLAEQFSLPTFSGFASLPAFFPQANLGVGEGDIFPHAYAGFPVGTMEEPDLTIV